jgi:flagellar biosynthesis protein FliP
MTRRAIRFVLAGATIAAGLAIAAPALAQQGPVELAADLLTGREGAEREPLSFSLQVLVLMTLLSVLPSVLLMMTAFTRIIIVLSILRQALGLQQTPPNQVLVGLSMFLTFFVMAPVFSQLNQVAVEPYTSGAVTIDQGIERGGEVLHAFMIKQTRDRDLKLFADLAGAKPFARPADVPFSILLPAFVTSELKTAFQIGFLIFLPFLVIDLVVASVLMSLGMMMLSPTLVSLPFKLLLFVAVDGWALTMSSLAMSFEG